MFETFELPFVRDGLVAVAFLAIAGGLLGTWIVLRGLAFYSHAVAAAAFPGLVLAGGLGFAAPLGAFGAGGLFAVTVGRLSARERRAGYDSVTALVLVAALAGGAILASDVFDSGTQVEAFLFGSLLAVDPVDQVLAAVTAALALVATLTLGPRWLATGFDAPAAGALGIRSNRTDLALLALVAVAAVSTLMAVGALLAGALLVVPAATARLWTRRLVTWQIASVVLAAVEGVAGLWLSVEVNAPPGATIAVLAAAVFALAPLVTVATRARRAALPAAVGAAVLLAGCGSEATSGKPVVVATTTQVADFARAVGGDAVEVHQILRPNTDPHEYEPRPLDVKATADATVVLASGVGLDEWVGEMVEAAGSDAARVELREAPEGADPHWWHDPTLVLDAIGQIEATLARAVPAQAEVFRRNAAAYAKRVRALDALIGRCMRSVPASERKLVTSHESFGHFADRYGIRVVGAVVTARSTEAQASAGEVAKLVRQVEREGVEAVFIDSATNPKLGEAVAREAGVADLRLHGDTLGPEGSEAGSYLGMERANADAMVRGFTGGKRGCG